MKTTVTISGNILSITQTTATSHSCPIVSLSGGMYYDKRTGEVKEKKVKAESRADNSRYVRRSFSDMRDWMNTNCRIDNTKFITLTYAENMQDHKKAVADFKNFYNRKVKKQFADAQYIYAIEPQGRGAWHIHMMLIFDNAHDTFIPNDVVAKWWGKGYTVTKNLDDIKGRDGETVDNIGAYLSAYLMDMPVDEVEDDIHSEKKDKKYIKGARLKLYPVGCHLWNRSKGLVKPERTVYDSMGDALRDNDLLGVEPTYENEKDIVCDNGYEVHVTYRQYNLSRIDRDIEKREEIRFEDIDFSFIKKVGAISGINNNQE